MAESDGSRVGGGGVELGAEVDIPASALVYAWIPFSVVVVATFIFSSAYVSLYKHKKDSACSATLTSILGVTVALLLAALAPVDIFLVSFMKNADGTFKSWARDNQTRDDVESAVSYAYVALFIALLLFLFLLLPFVYFFYEEKDDEGEEGAATVGRRCCTAFKYSSVFVVLGGVLLLTGAFLPMTQLPPSNSTENGTSWEEKIAFLIDELGANRGEDTLAFSVNIVTILGMIAVVVYTAFGLSAMPLELIKGRRDVKTELEETREKRRTVSKRVKDIRDKYFDFRQMGQRDQRRLREAEENEAVLSAQERELQSRADSCFRTCLRLCRPMRVFAGLLFLLLSLLIAASLLIGNVDKALHSLGPRMGYALPRPTLPNPVDIVLQYAQRVFPLDYVIILLIVLHLFLASMAGIRELGVWCLCIRAYKVRPQRSRPQALLFLSFLLMFVVLGINILIYFMAPMYALYGNQHYISNGTTTTTTAATTTTTTATTTTTTTTTTTVLNGSQHYIPYATFDDLRDTDIVDNTTTPNVTSIPTTAPTTPLTTTTFTTTPTVTTSPTTAPVVILKCTTDAPPESCILTRMGVFLNRYFFKTWFFGACYYWAVWVFCGTFVLGFLVSVFKPRKSAISGIVDSEDFEESDDAADDDAALLVNRRGDGDDALLRA